jgi:hypothetical protein
VTSENVGINHDIHPFIRTNLLSSITEHCNSPYRFYSKRAGHGSIEEKMKENTNENQVKKVTTEGLKSN